MPLQGQGAAPAPSLPDANAIADWIKQAPGLAAGGKGQPPAPNRPTDIPQPNPAQPPANMNLIGAQSPQLMARTLNSMKEQPDGQQG
jgi:hypothetical protein